MTPGGRASAAMEILETWGRSDMPADRIVETWGRAHRFAGSKDRAAIAALVYAAFRRRGPIARHMGSDAPRALVLGALRLADGLSPQAIADLCQGPHGPAPVSAEERAALSAPEPPDDPIARLPDWLVEPLAASLGEDLAAEAACLSTRAPADLRVNGARTTRAAVIEALAAEGFAARPCPFAPDGLRLEGHPRLDRSALVRDGLVEPQDEGSQIATRLVDPRPGHRVLDLCAGAGGKTLGLAALMDGRGVIDAYDLSPRRLAQIPPRAARAGAGIIRLSPPDGLYDRVLVDAPCSGSGTWRRAPDAPWRLTPSRLAAALDAQASILARAATHVAVSGRLVYVTCSLLRAENEDRVAAFLETAAGRDFEPLDWRAVWGTSVGGPAPETAPKTGPKAASSPFLRLSPARHGTDGFFVAILERRGGSAL